MKERPILFSGPMVQAILDGRKTQTRRIVKPQPISDLFRIGHYHETCVDRNGNEYPSCDEMFGISSDDGEWSTKCPYGEPGDRLWVRETFMVGADEIAYAATDQPLVGCDRWRPSIHMNRVYSRLDLEITGVRVEQLNEISEKDVMAEGVELDVATDHRCGAAYTSFKSLWESINGRGSWALNPWVWVVEFKRVNGGEK